MRRILKTAFFTSWINFALITRWMIFITITTNRRSWIQGTDIA
jgi:hypothetical protein